MVKAKETLRDRVCACLARSQLKSKVWYEFSLHSVIKHVIVIFFDQLKISDMIILQKVQLFNSHKQTRQTGQL